MSLRANQVTLSFTASLLLGDMANVSKSWWLKKMKADTPWRSLAWRYYVFLASRRIQLWFFICRYLLNDFSCIAWGWNHFSVSWLTVRVSLQSIRISEPISRIITTRSLELLILMKNTVTYRMRSYKNQRVTQSDLSQAEDSTIPKQSMSGRLTKNISVLLIGG